MVIWKDVKLYFWYINFLLLGVNVIGINNLILLLLVL